MRVNAYVLAADPAWLTSSVWSYYNLGDQIVVSFDESNTSLQIDSRPQDSASD